MVNKLDLVGVVEWYTPEKGYGVIRGDDNQGYFIHHTNLPREQSNLQEGMRVSYRARRRPYPKSGMEAYNLIQLEPRLSGLETTGVPQIVVRKAKNYEEGHEFDNGDVSEFNADHKQVNNELVTAPSEDCVNKLISHSNEDDRNTTRSRYIAQPDSNYHHYRGRMITERVKGVTFEGRQNIVAELSVEEKLLLIREPQNRFDRNAIRVERSNGEQVGYIDRNLAAKLATIFDEYRKPVSATVDEITGGVDTGTYLGARIKFKVPGTPLRAIDEGDDLYNKKPIIIQVANSNKSVNMLDVPAEFYQLQDVDGNTISKQKWDPSSQGYCLIWKNYVRAGYSVVI